MGWLTATLVTTEEKLQYTAIIDAILATADLETISRKKIRQGLETSLGGKDLSEQKVVFFFFFFLSAQLREARLVSTVYEICHCFTLDSMQAFYPVEDFLASFGWRHGDLSLV